MKKILIATDKPFSKPAVQAIQDVIKEAGYESVLLEKYSSASEFHKAAADVDAIIIRSDVVDKEVIKAAKNLKIVVRAGAGYDNVDLAAASERGIVVMNTPGQNSNAVAELVFGMLVYLNRGGFDGSSGTELRNKKIGIHAYGYVGRIVALIAKGFGMKVYAHDPFVDRVIIENDGVKWEESAAEMYSKCQYVSLHIPANKQTKETINFELLNSMPEGATLVNTARKEVIHEPSLIKMFEQRDDFRYATDIEPDCKEQLAKYKGRYFATPKKMGAQTAEANLNAGVAAARQIINFLDKGDTTFQVNK
ncbi:MAG: 3-phosphoglycerate dehydrogenase [Bacteroidales bacterium]|nr:3-phosphoglycerate dehydrogenase [Bacteroidales bacterium]MCB9000005.1 3-phosphoglycerate dehydrogenase [Bacteroidales bacterium]MCB9013265.1 3-phosphoglycerate dehydrogenase [Bacteroidales bacterium]